MENTTKPTRLERIEQAIERNREMLSIGGDVTYYAKQILNLNRLADKLDKELKTN